jgi:quercetin dioxygenase-like cupin family protein
MRHFLAPLVAGLLACSAGAYGQDAGTNLKWGPAPSAFPAGAQMAVVSGDPGKSGPFVVQLSFPEGYQIKSHTHPTDENIHVVKGTFLVGKGKTWDAAALKPMTPGASGMMPAGMAHFAQAKEPTVVQVTSTGPFAMTYVSASDDPRAKATP